MITPIPEAVRPSAQGSLELERAAVVEVTSEEKEFPVESALLAGETCGWRAASPGTQTIRLVFDELQKLKHISLISRKNKRSARKNSSCDGLRIKGNRFEKLCASSGTSAHPTQFARTEEYQLELSGVTVLELTIVPDVGGGTAHASLKSMRLR